MKTVIIDLTSYDMMPWDGYQCFSLFEAEEFFKRGVPNKFKKDYFIDKDDRPLWWYGSPEWRQTWTIRKKEFIK